MTNPWLQIPASDYERHMGNPNVAQLSFLADVFKSSLERHHARDIALLGCATGNGLEYVNTQITKRVVAVDINPEYLEILNQRYCKRIPGLSVVEADLEVCELDKGVYSLIFAGLVFEYVNPKILLPKIAQWLCLDGILVSVLQLPAVNSEKVSETPYQSLKLLGPYMKLVTPEEFKSAASAAGLVEVESKIVTLKSGKPFHLGTYVKV